jgi:predicted unusual protein kinase regulating ubiquinone biosynthesis (AarF/ABC1/UbiB family)
MFDAIFRHGLFNADPHPGNYLFQNGRVVFLDFGCVKRYDPTFLPLWMALIRSNLEQDRATFKKAIIAMEMTSDPEHFNFGYFFDAFSFLYTPWLQDRPFAYSPEFVRKTFENFVLAKPDKFRISMVKELIFTNRIQWGVTAHVY